MYWVSRPANFEPWIEVGIGMVYGQTRTRTKKRIDKGLQRPTKADKADDLASGRTLSNAQWKKRHRESIEESLSNSSPGKRQLTEADLPEAWAAGHTKELAFNKGKEIAKLFEAVHVGTVDRSELTPEQLVLCDAHFENKKKNMVPDSLCVAPHLPPPLRSCVGVQRALGGPVEGTLRQIRFWCLIWESYP